MIKLDYKSVAIICTYRPSGYLTEMIQSIVDNGGIYLIYIYDWGSSDASRTLIEGMKATFDVEIVTHYNADAPGPAISFHEAIKHVSKYDTEATHFYLCDQDDVWLDSKVSEYSCFYRSDIPQLLASDVELVNASLSPLDKRFYGGTFNYPVKHPSVIFFNPIIGMTMCLNRPLLERVAGLTMNKAVIMHDWLIFAAVVFLDIDFKCIQKKLVLYRQHEENYLGIDRKSFLKKIIYSRSYIKKVKNQLAFFSTSEISHNLFSLNKVELAVLLVKSPMVRWRFKALYFVSFILFW